MLALIRPIQIICLTKKKHFVYNSWGQGWHTHPYVPRGAPWKAFVELSCNFSSSSLGAYKLASNKNLSKPISPTWYSVVQMIIPNYIVTGFTTFPRPEFENLQISVTTWTWDLLDLKGTGGYKLDVEIWGLISRVHNPTLQIKYCQSLEFGSVRQKWLFPSQMEGCFLRPWVLFQK